MLAFHQCLSFHTYTEQTTELSATKEQISHAVIRMWAQRKQWIKRCESPSGQVASSSSPIYVMARKEADALEKEADDVNGDKKERRSIFYELLNDD